MSLHRKSRDLVEAVRRDPDFLQLQQSHPLQARIYLVCVQKLQEACQVCDSELQSSPTPEAFKRFHKASEQYLELASWVAEPVGYPTEDVKAVAAKFVRAGLPWDSGEEYIKLFSKGKGRPATGKRLLAVYALEKRLRPNPPSWRRLAIDLQYCADDPDVEDRSEKCRDRLRHQVSELESLLNKCKIRYKDLGTTK